MEYTITQSLMTNNPRYKNQTKRNKHAYMQHSTGAPGVKAKDLINKWNRNSAQAEVEFIIDETGIYQIMPIGIKTWHCGGSANNTHVGCEICEPENARFIDANWLALSYGGRNNTKYAVTMLQKELNAWGYKVDVDGRFGPATKSAVIAFQKDNGLKQDGSVGLATLHVLQKRQDSFMSYNIKKNQAYFEDVYRKAIFTCAYVLNRLCVKNVDKNTIVSHAEGYKLGIASNHADINHFAILHGKTMDDFRKDAKIYLNEGKLPYEQLSDDDLAWNIGCRKGIFQGANKNKAVTQYQLASILYNIGVIE